MGTPPAATFAPSKPEAAPVYSPARPDASGGDLILLVEDNDTVAQLLVQILSRIPRQVVRARDGAECLCALEEHAASIGLVILDCRLPDTDGVVLCEEVRRRLPQVPVLLTSGRDHSKAAVVTCGGASGFLSKPFRPIDVQEKITALLGVVA